MDLLTYLFAEVRNGRLRKPDALTLLRQLHAPSPGEMAGPQSLPERTVLLIPRWKASAGTRATQTYGERWIVLGWEGDDPGRVSDEWRTVATHIASSKSLILQSPAGTAHERFADYALQLIECLKSVLRSKPRTEVIFQVAIGGHGAHATLSGLGALFKTAQLENPRIRGQVIGVEGIEDAPGVLRVLEAEIALQDVEIRYRDGHRCVVTLEEAAPSTEVPHPWKDDGVYLITGGAGGLALVFAREIASRVRGAKLVLAGRSPLSEGRGREIAELRNNSAQASYLRLDVSDRHSVEQGLNEILSRHTRLDGVIHAAGVIRDSYLLKKTEDELRAVFEAKVAGVVNLDESTAALDLDVFITFSSGAGVFGNIGQSDYAMANAFMDAHVLRRAVLVEQGKRHGRSLSIAWPLWAEGGMKIDAATRAWMETVGITAISTQRGIEVLYRALAGGQPNVAVMSLKPEERAAGISTAADQAEYEVVEEKAIDDATLLLKTQQRVLQLFAEVSGVAAHEVDVSQPLEVYGIDSIMITALNMRLTKDFGELSKTLFYEYPTLGELNDYLVSEHRARCVRWTNAESRERATKAATAQVRTTAEDVGLEPIAVVGLSGRYPRAKNITAYWENLAAGRDCIGEIPPERWSLDEFYCEGVEEALSQGKSYSKWGGFIDDFAAFDALFFGISPREAAGMDPQERLFLQSCWEVMEDSGYTRESLAEKHSGRVGVFAGITKTGFDLYGPEFWRRGQAVLPLTSFSSVANRVSYFLNLNGPSMPIDTMCSASLTAIHEACEHLRREECELAIAGGVNLYLHPTNYVALCGARMLSASGRCRSFGRGGDGMVPGEGVGTVLLKRLSRAVRDRDHIYGLIRGTSINHGGKTNGYTVPNPQAQRELIRTALHRAGVNARQVSYIEAHGTGTTLGDPIEITGLAQAFARDTQDRQFCAIGSVKSNIGHCEAAAGIAAVTKVLMQMKHGQLAPTLHVQELNENITFEATPFVVQRELAPWNRPRITVEGDQREYPRIAGISSFGAGGSNAHVVVEEYPDPGQVTVGRQVDKPAVVVLSAKDGDRLKEQIVQLLDALDHGGFEEPRLADIAYTLQVGREPMECRIGVLASSVSDLREKLSRCTSGAERIEGVYRGDARRGRSHDRQLQEAAGKRIERRDYAGLLELWVQGLALDWEEIHDEPKPRRISLPTYPFARERYWVDFGATDGAESAPTSTGEREPDRLMVFEERWEPSPQGLPGSAELGTVVCLAHPGTTAASLQQAALGLGIRGRLVFVELGSGAGAEAHLKALESAKSDFGPIDALLYLAEGEHCRNALAPLYVLQALHKSGITEARVFLAGLYSDAITRSYTEAWIGHVRSVRLALPQLKVAVILQRRATEETPDTWARRILEEMQRTAVQSALYEDGRRHVLVTAERELETGGKILRDGGTYLITGGAGALGSLLAGHLTQRFGARVMLTGRAEIDPAMRSRIDALQASGGEIAYRQADVCDPRQMREVIRAVRERFGTLHGVIHAAGIQSSEPFFAKTSDSFERVLAPKILGTLVLDEALQGVPLDFICYFSSVAAVLGDFGSLDYSAANRFQMAHANNCTGVRRIAIGWPLWGAGAMKFADAASTELYCTASGQTQLGTADGLRLFEQLLAGSCLSPLVFVGRPNGVRRALGLHEEHTNRARPNISGARSDLRGLTTQECIEREIRDAVGKVLAIAPSRLQAEENLATFGFDSITLGELARRLSELYGINLVPSVFFSCPTMEKLTAMLLVQHAGAVERRYANPTNGAPTTASRKTRTSRPVVRHVAEQSLALDEPIAIIGMSGRFPQARDVEEMWQILVEGREALGSAPQERAGWQGCREARLGAVPGADEFDPGFFEISPKEATLMDPRQRLLLQEGWRALEDAGYGAERLRRNKIGVFVGVEQGDYQVLLMGDGTITSNHDGVLAARLGYFLDLRGPAVAVNTSCSSGLVALHQACMSLRAGDCSTAIVAGVNLMMTGVGYEGMRAAGMLSSDGRCYPFDTRANGLVPAEAVVALVLTKLSSAESERDRVHAVIRASGMNFDGRTNGITAPNGAAQAQLIREVYERAGVDTRQIEYVVAHGTGTRLGDPVEVNALAEVFKDAGSQGTGCALTSPKSNFGHSFAASGLLSLVSLVQSLRYQTIPRSLNCESVSDYIDWAAGSLRVNTSNRPWPVRQSGQRLGAVSAFGMSGTNAHVVVEGYDEAVAGNVVTQAPCILLVLSAKSAEALKQKLQDLRQFILGSTPEIDASAVSYTLLCGRQHFAHRCAVVAQDAAHAAQLLNELLESQTAPNLFVGKVDRQWQPQRSMARYGQRLMEEINSAQTSQGFQESLYALAELYCQGYQLEWESLFGADRPRPVSLPTYPFSRERYFISDRQGTGTPWLQQASLTEAPIAVAPRASDKPTSVSLSELTDAPVTVRALPNSVPSIQPAKLTDMTGPSLEAVMQELTRMLADALYIELAEIEIDRPLVEMGLDSIIGVEWVRMINRRFSLEMPVAKIYDYPDLRQLSRYLVDSLQGRPAARQDVEPVAELRDSRNVQLSELSEWAEPPEASGSEVIEAPTGAAAGRGSIAIVGMSARYPQAADLGEFWLNLAQGRDSVVEVPRTRWDVTPYFDERRGQPGKVYSKWLGALADVECFDPLFFGIAPAEAERMDPQQRLFLEEGYRAFEDAGYDPRALGNTQCGVYLGIMGSEYGSLLQMSGMEADTTGNSAAIAASRLAYVLNLKGPAISIDTACSSSLVATHLGCQALRAGEVDMALVGGVTLYLTAAPHLGMCAAGMLSADGRCKTMDCSADGFVPGEGVGALVLKRLEDAILAGDRIHGVIIGSGINQDGKTNGITAPSGMSQSRLAREVYARYGIDPETIGYVELHGTGTKLGDPVELGALSTVFEETTSRKGFCGLGSVKSNIGHTSAAAGVAGVHKVLLCLRHRQLVPTLHFQKPNEHFDFAASPFYVNTELRDWDVPAGAARRAAVSSFGYSGTNAHVVIQEYVGAPKERIEVSAQHPAMVVLSGRDEVGLRARVSQLLQGIRSGRYAEADLGNIAYTLQVGREAMEHRLALEVGSLQELQEKLQRYEQGEQGIEGVYTGDARRGREMLLVLGGDEDLTKLVESWVERRRYGKLLDLWVKGLSFDWRGLWVGRQPQRLSLPSYPFARERYWVGSVLREGGPRKGQLHPLLQQNVSDLTEQRYESCFSGEEFFLEDHRVSGSRLLPGAAYLEMVRAALEHGSGMVLADGVGVELRNLVWSHPVVVQPGESQRVYVGLYEAEDAGEEVFYEIYSEREAGRVVHSQGAAAAVGGMEVPEVLQIQTVLQSGSIELDAAECYRRYGEFGLEYGPAHRGLRTLRSGWDAQGRRCVVAQVGLPESVSSTAQQYVLHPSVLDGALQGLLGLRVEAQERAGGPGAGAPLPYAVERVRISGRCAGEVYAVIRERAPGGKVDVQVCEPGGRVCVHLQGLSTREWRARELEQAAAGDDELQSLEVGHAAAGDDESQSIEPGHAAAGDDASQGVEPGHAELQNTAPRGVASPDAMTEEAVLLARRWRVSEVLASAGSSVMSRSAESAELVMSQLTVSAASVSESAELVTSEPAVSATSMSESAESVTSESAVSAASVSESAPGVASAAGLATTGTESAQRWVVLVAGEPGEARVCEEWATHLRQQLPGVRCEVLEAAGTGLAERFTDSAVQLMQQLQTVLRGRPRQPVWVQVVIPEAQPAPRGLFGALGGLLKSAQWENPQVRGQLIRVEEADSASGVLQKLQAEVGGTEVEIRYQGAERSVAVWEPLTAAAPESALPWKPDGVYLLSGGAGGLGLLFAREILARRPQARLILAGRGELTQVQQTRLQELGDRVQYLRMDVSDREAVERAVAEVLQRHGRLDGLIHAAGVLRDSFLLKKSEGQLRAVFAGKVSGVVNLDEATAGLGLDFFAVFGSVAGVYGNVGQADYAAANAFMDAYVAMRAHWVQQGLRRGRSVSMDWPLWAQGGMGVEAGQAPAGALSTPRGLEAFYRAFGTQETQVLVLPAHGSVAAGAPAGVSSELRGTQRDVVGAAHAGASNEGAWLQPTASVASASNEGTQMQPIASESVAASEGARLQSTVAGAGVTGESLRLQSSAGQERAQSELLQERLSRRTREYLKKLVSGALKVGLEKLEEEEALERYGLDSILVLQMTQELESRLGSLSKTLFFEYPSIRELSEYLIEAHRATLLRMWDLQDRVQSEPASPLPVSQAPATAQVPRRRRRSRVSAAPALAAAEGVGEIAIVGLSGRYAQARDLEQYWQNLRKGLDCITEIPPERWDQRGFFDEHKGTAGRSYSKWGGFIEGVDEFDPLFFNISPLEAGFMDPQERLFLQCVYETLEDAGYTRELLRDGAGGAVGVFVGVMYEEYQLYGAQAQALGQPLGLGGNPSSIANRVSYFCNFQGPSLAVDTMCSSSLTAIHLASESLKRGECVAALAGGVNVSIHPNKYLLLSQGQFASSKGRCESFGEGGDGYVPGEGVGAVLLKPLQRAIEDGDQIYGVIRGSSVNHGGKSNGYTVPNPQAQAQVIERALRSAGVSAREVSYIEAHGTGTSLGDPVEIAGLSQAFGRWTQEKQFCAIGSVKSNIGHCESAAGIAGVTKILLQMKHGELVPSLHAQRLNPYIEFAASPFVVQRELSRWERPVWRVEGERREGVRIAGISGFGAGGANAHVVIQEYVGAPKERIEVSAQHPAMVVLSGRDEVGLRARVSQLLQGIRSGRYAEADLGNIAYTLQVGREAMEHRLALLVGSLGELAEKLERVLAGEPGIEELYRGEVKRNKDALAVFAADEELREAIGKWVSRGKYGQLLDLWVKGLVFDWRGLWAGQRPQRLSLPTYPFARERHWLPATLQDMRGGITAPAPLQDKQSSLVMLAPIWERVPRTEWQHTDEKQLRDDDSVLLVGGTAEQRAQIGESHPSIAWVEEDEVHTADSLSERLRRVGSIDHVVWIAPLNVESPIDDERLIEGQVNGVLGLHRLIRALLAQGYGHRELQFTSITVRAQPVHQAEHIDPTHASVHGLVGSLAKEHSRWKIKLVDLENAESLRWEELLRVPPDEQGGAWCRRGGDWYRQKLLPYEAQRSGTGTLYRDGGVYVILGGAGGVGEIYSAHLIRRHRARVIWIGRREEDDAIRNKRQRLAQLGMEPEYETADATDRTALTRACERIKARHGKIHGVIHSAVGIFDESLEKMSEERFARILSVKVDISVRLAQVFGDEPLDFVMFFSSLSSFAREAGKSGYSAGSTFEDAYAHELARAWSCPVKVMNWGWWGDIGTAAEMPQASKNRMALAGVGSLSPQEGMQALDTLLECPLEQLGVIKTTTQKVPQSNSNARPSAEGVGLTDETLQERSTQFLKGLVGKTLRIPVEQIDADEPLETYGIDSILVARLTDALRDSIPNITSTLFFEHPNVAGLVRHLMAKERQALVTCTGLSALADPTERVSTPVLPPSEKQVGRTSERAIAIVGLSGRYPQARTLEEFWENLKAGRDCIVEVPAERWPLDDFYCESIEQAIAQRKSYCKWGGFVDGFAEFDSFFFNIPPRDAQGMDPQERLFMQSCWEVLENGGYTRETLARRHGGSVGVFAGVTKTGFELYTPELARRGRDELLRTSFSSLANRVSYHLNLNGPSMAIDTMCSASLTAIHEACENLLRGECEVAIAGGVNLYLHPDNYITLCAARMLSPDGRCRSFGRSANGMVPGEGVGTVLLKRLAQAEADGDYIHGVIRSTSVNHGGKTNGYTVPNPQAQRHVIRRALEKAGVDARVVSYIEAHGTGTELGDPIEIAGLTQAFQMATADKGFCAIGSVKSNIGHAEAAAGIAGLTKVLLQMKHGMLVPSLHTETLNPRVDFTQTPFIVQKQLSSWSRPILTINGETTEHPRIAGISGFGAGGSNAHAVIEEYVGAPRQRVQVGAHNPALFVLSARDDERLLERARQLLNLIEAGGVGDVDLADVAYTLQVAREPMEQRVAFPAHSVAELSRRLKGFVAGEQQIEELYRGEVKGNKEAMSAIAADEEMQEAVGKWMARGKYYKLLALWVKGLPIKWDDLYGETTPRRIPLPTYPFAKERHWLPMDLLKSDSPPALPAEQTMLLAPVWERVQSPVEEPCVPNQSIVVLGGTPAQQAELRNLHPSIRTVESAGDRTVQELTRDIEACDRVDHVVWIAPVVADLSVDGEAVISAHRLVVLGCYRVIKALQALGYDHRALEFTALTVRAQATDGAQRVDPTHASVHGLIGSLAKEFGRWKVRLIDQEARDGWEWEKLLRVPPDAHGDAWVCRAGEWYRQALRPCEVEIAPTEPYRRGGVYVIVGGAGGLGERVSEHLVGRYGAHVIWLGRRAEDEAIRSKRERLARLGPEPEYLQADATDLQALIRAREDIRSRHAAVHGVIHSAVGIFDDGLAALSEDRFAEILSVKVSATARIAQVFGRESLDFLLLFSSFASFRKEGGKSGYSAGSLFEDAFAREWARTVPYAVKVVNWGWWGSVGSAGRMPEAFRRQAAAAGVRALDTEDGLKALDALLRGPFNQLAVVKLESAEKLQRETFANSGAPAPLEEETVRRRGNLYLRKLISTALRMPVERIEASEPLESYGIDSIHIARLTEVLKPDIPSVSTSLFFEKRSIAGLVEYFLANERAALMRLIGLAQTQPTEGTARPARQETESRSVGNAHSQSAPERAVAIVGLSGQYPRARTLQEFWENLKAGRDCIGEIPRERWPLDGFYCEGIETALSQGKSYCKWGGFLDGFAEFDAQFFNISVREAESIDPQERLFMQSCWDALEDGAYTRDVLHEQHGGRVGVFAGVTKTGFELYGPELRRRGEAGFPRISFGSVANRVSYFLNITGPSMPIDTMCSASLTAIHEACEHILRDECEVALAGGVNLYLHPSDYLALSFTRMLSPGGRCRSFGRGSDGMVPGEAVGTVLLKRVSMAERDGDHIYGVIRATSINHGGKTNGYTVPNPLAQGALVRAALQKAGLNARMLSYIEAHGTGTQLGDPVEITGLTQAFAQDTSDTQFCALGSVKSNIGHCESAAGIAAVTKVLLQMKHATLVPTLHADELNPHIDFANGPFIVQRETAEWRRPVITIDGCAQECSRIAGISSFGAGGSNAHVLIEEYREPATRLDSAAAGSGPAIVVLSAKDEERLAERVRQLIVALEDGGVGADQLANVAYTLQVGREAMEQRLGLIVHSIPELLRNLRRWASGEGAIEELYCGDVKRNREMLATLAADDGLGQLVDMWIEKRNYTQLLEMWVKGLSFDWKRLYAQTRPRRLSLPGYPFARRRIWISAWPDESSAEMTSVPDASSEEGTRDALDLLLDAVMNNSISIDDAVARAERSVLT